MSKLLLVLCCYFLVAEGTAPRFLRPSGNLRDREVINDYADRVISNLRDFLIVHNLDPLRIPHLELNFTYDFLFATREADITLDNGILTDLSTLKRTGDAIVDYEGKQLEIILAVGVDNLQASFDFELHTLGLKPNGNLFADLVDQEIDIDLLFDFDETKFTLRNFQILSNGKINIKLDDVAGVIGDALANVLIAAIAALFKNSIVGTISQQISDTLGQLLDNLPPILPPIPDVTEQPPVFNVIEAILKNIHVISN